MSRTFLNSAPHGDSGGRNTASAKPRRSHTSKAPAGIAVVIAAVVLSLGFGSAGALGSPDNLNFRS